LYVRLGQRVARRLLGVNPEVFDMSFGIYIVGFIIVIAGLAIGANMLHVPPQWIGVGVLIMAGLGIVMGVSRTRQKDPS